MTSFDETLNYLERNDDVIYYRSTIFDKTPRAELKERAIKILWLTILIH